MAEQIVSENNREFLEDVSPSKLQQLVSEIFSSILSRNNETVVRNSIAKKFKSYSKHWSIVLPESEEELEDKILIDMIDREKERTKKENDFLDELKIYDLRVISDYWK